MNLYANDLAHKAFQKEIQSNNFLELIFKVKKHIDSKQLGEDE